MSQFVESMTKFRVVIPSAKEEKPTRMTGYGRTLPRLPQVRNVAKMAETDLGRLISEIE